MKLDGNTVLITGGSSGIGLDLAERFSEAGSQVIVCGRREDVLHQAKMRLPFIHTRKCDVSSKSERESLFNWAHKEFPNLNILINNAGIQNRPPKIVEQQSWERHELEIAINLEAPMHLSFLFTNHLMKQPVAAIMNVTSGLAFLPLAFMPTYCATKAALHSFTMSLRHQLKSTSIEVYEIIPPAVNTDLGGKGLHNDGVPLNAFADHAIEQIEKGQLEFGFGFSETSRRSNREQLDELFSTMNGRGH